MESTWSETKRAANLKAHSLDFVDAPRVFEGTTYTFEDDRFSYGERRFVTLGLSLAFQSQSFTRRPTMKSASSRFAKQPPVKQTSSSMKSNTDWARLKAKAKSTTPTTAHLEADIRHIVRGVVRRGLQPVPSKSSISLRVDQDVLEWFKAQGPGYQTRINTVLRAFRDASV